MFIKYLARYHITPLFLYAGAASPQSMRKMMALAEAKTKPYHGPRPSSTPSLGGLTVGHHSSPGPSPRAPRRGPTGALAGGLANITTSHLTAASNLAARTNHERSHSDTPAIPVDLSVESSSVTSLSNIRKSLTQGNCGKPKHASLFTSSCTNQISIVFIAKYNKMTLSALRNISISKLEYFLHI